MAFVAPKPSRGARSSGRAYQGVLKLLEHADDEGAVPRRRESLAVTGDEREEVPALEPERLVVRDLRDVDVAGARPPLAVALGALLGALVVDGHLALELHVVEDGHLVPADYGQLPHLVRVEPGEVHVRHDARREAEVAEDDVLDAFVDERLAARPDLRRLLADQVQDHREVVDAERPERVLVLADLAEILTVAVDVEDLAQLAPRDQLAELRDGRVVQEQVAR